jgi:hypothetical protein
VTTSGALRVFLSSSFLASDEGREDVASLRLDLRERLNPFGVELILPETLDEVKGLDGDLVAIMEACGRLARNADAFVGLLHSRHGSRIEIHQDGLVQRAEVSVFESELLNACIKEKPTLLIRVDGFEPNPSLAEFLQLVEPILGGSTVSGSTADLAGIIRSFAETIRAARLAKLPWLPDRIGRQRTHANPGRELSDPRLAFLHGGLAAAAVSEPNVEVIQRGLTSSRAGVDPQLGKLGQASRLSLLWLAMRELMKANDQRRSDDLFDLWTGTLKEWNSAAAWFGLHGFHPMGCLATLNSLTHAQRLRGSFKIETHGARASAYYSTAGQMQAPPLRRQLYGYALQLSHQAAHGKTGLELASALGVRASCRLQHGGYLAAPGALGDYRRALHLREKHGAGDFAVGESMSEYGYAVGRVPLRGKEGIALVERGSAMMLTAGIGHPSQRGFYLRSRRKLAELLIRQGRPTEAITIIDEAIGLGVDSTVSDQVWQLEDLRKWAVKELAAPSGPPP